MPVLGFRGGKMVEDCVEVVELEAVDGDDGDVEPRCGC